MLSVPNGQQLTNEMSYGLFLALGKYWPVKLSFSSLTLLGNVLDQKVRMVVTLSI